MATQGALSGDNNGSEVQGFAPSEIKLITSGDIIDMKDYMAFRCTDTTEYKLNAIGNTSILSAGMITVRSNGVKTIQFLTNTVIEFM